MSENKQHHTNETLPEPIADSKISDPVDRISELLYGLFMALSFTCTISVINNERTEVKDMLIGALGCNIAWGLVDAVMYLLMNAIEKGRGLDIYNFVRKSNDSEKANQFIADSLPPVIASMLQKEELDKIRNKLLQMPESPLVKRFTLNDLKSALAIFFIVFFSTLPVVIPFIFIDVLQTALRTSNLIAIVMMFICGWHLAKYSGQNKFLTGVILSLLGIALVLITISLGG